MKVERKEEILTALRQDIAGGELINPAGRWIFNNQITRPELAWLNETLERLLNLEMETLRALEEVK